MKITITDIGWGIDRRTGIRTEQVLARDSYEAKENLVMVSGPLKKEFKVVYLEKDRIDIWLREDKVMTFFRGDKFNFYPLSRDGGHYYILEFK